MDDETRAKLREVQHQLQTKWLRSLPDKCEPLRDALARSGESDDAREELRRLAHKLRGSAGSFGCADIGDAAAAAEDADDVSLADAARALIERMLAEHEAARASGRFDD